MWRSVLFAPLSISITKLFNSNGLPLVHDDDAMLGSYEREDLMLPMMGDVSVGTKENVKDCISSVS
jgi:hypothetical protein